MMIRPFHKIQPRPRAQVARSSGSAARNTSRLSPRRRVEAIARSQAGSPTPDEPKSTVLAVLGWGLDRLATWLDEEKRRKLMTNEKTEQYELRLERLLDAPRAKVWRCWTEPRLLEQWFAPQSWTTEVKTLELRAGGASHIVMRGPDGGVADGVGVFLEAVPEQRLVFTNAFTSGWIPSVQPAVVPFMTTIVEMSDEGGKTRYVVRALHWTDEARKQHEEMGFHAGWGQTAGQLEALAWTL
jgi:uncharacterized protein YndB with AHSA1/START domain